MASTTAASRTRTIVCELSPQKSASSGVKREVQIPRPRSVNLTTEAETKIMLQPRLCTLRSYGPETRDAIVKLPRQSDNTTQFFASLADYIESSKKSRDFETIIGRLAMIVFAATVSSEFVTGDSLFKKLDMQQLEEALGVCLAVVASAATFAWFTSARSRIGQIFTLSCNAFVDSLIDNLVEALFYESELNDWSDE
ncbi:Stress enhanced protein 2 [Rhynchospora pubera]|uniref:Stress enhanced protein 2 n=1 Tax=Rhynchospora pubera TaxID=906938 RepID=A0AAV8D0V3_9POAL|nr:Stress enhanced protein 2 [Rhynchospora pubera]